MSASTAPSIQAAYTVSTLASHQPFSQPELMLNDRDGTPTQSDAAILPGLGDVLVSPENTSVVTLNTP